jgi:hypothetical protein
MNPFWCELVHILARTFQILFALHRIIGPRADQMTPLGDTIVILGFHSSFALIKIGFRSN